MIESIDIKENSLLEIDKELLDILLKDRTTGANILWATDNYEQLGYLYKSDKQILPVLITGANGEIIKPRIKKTKEEQQARIRGKAEVFTPSWVCNCQNNLIDDAWFGYSGAFNIEGDKCWTATPSPVKFPEGKTWQDYVQENRLEITCGEAPYLVSRYDTVSGKEIPIKSRIGLLDRKLRVIGENVSEQDEWFKWAKKAYQCVFGYEWQGDNLLLARENLLYTFTDYYEDKFGETPDKKLLLEIAEIISWNIWQMDGLKFVIPNSCKSDMTVQLSLFEEKPTEHPCEGCTKNKIFKHNGIYCKIKNWQTNRPIKFISLLKNK